LNVFAPFLLTFGCKKRLILQHINYAAMLGLKLATDPRWVNIVESNIEEILTDHAWCEQKAASNAISIVITT